MAYFVELLFSSTSHIVLPTHETVSAVLLETSPARLAIMLTSLLCLSSFVCLRNIRCLQQLLARKEIKFLVHSAPLHARQKIRKILTKNKMIVSPFCTTPWFSTKLIAVTSGDCFFFPALFALVRPLPHVKKQQLNRKLGQFDFQLLLLLVVVIVHWCCCCLDRSMLLSCL